MAKSISIADPTQNTNGLEARIKVLGTNLFHAEVVYNSDGVASFASLRETVYTAEERDLLVQAVAMLLWKARATMGFAAMAKPATQENGDMVYKNQTTAGLTAARAVYQSGKETWSHTNLDTLPGVPTVAVYEGTTGEVRSSGKVTMAFTTAGGQPVDGAAVFLAPAAEDGAGLGVGKLTATYPVTGEAVQVGTCLDNANYAAAKTCLVAFNVDIPGSGHYLGAYTNATRPAASTTNTGDWIFNTSDTQPQWSNGTNWYTAAGVQT